MSGLSSSSVILRSLILGGVALAVVSSSSFAQGRGGGRGGGGGGRGGGFGGAPVSPMDRVKEELKETDELEFLDKRSKQLSLDKEQKEMLKTLNKEMDDLQKPIFKEMEKTFSDLERGAAQGGGSFGGGRGAGDDDGGRGGRGGMPPGIRESVVKLADIQAAFAERAAVILRDNQKPLADSLRLIYKDELRESAARKARSRAGGMGRGG